MNVVQVRISPRLLPLAAASILAGCVLDPKSAGDLEGMSGAASESDGDGGESDGAPDPSDGDADDGAPGDGGPAGDPPTPGCGDDCSPPTGPQWSDVIPTDSGRTWACDVAIDSSGRVAIAWHIEPGPSNAVDVTGIDLYEPDGTKVVGVSANEQIFGAIAFASDGSLRVRGADALGDNEYVEWAMALDGGFATEWTQTYREQSGWGQCGWGSRGIAVDAGDNVVTYEYVPSFGNAGSMLRRHAPSGELQWEYTPGGNPSFQKSPVAVAPDQTVLVAPTLLYDNSSEVEVHKVAADGTLLWTGVVPGEANGIWSAADGGAFVFTHGFFSPQDQLHRLGPAGALLWSATAPDDIAHVVGPTADETGVYGVSQDALHRLTPGLEPVWSTPFEHANAWTSASATRDGIFAMGGSATNESDNYWISVVSSQ